jgi:hypothetical protein
MWMAPNVEDARMPDVAEDDEGPPRPQQLDAKPGAFARSRGLDGNVHTLCAGRIPHDPRQVLGVRVAREGARGCGDPREPFVVVSGGHDRPRAEDPGPLGVEETERPVSGDQHAHARLEP